MGSYNNWERDMREQERNAELKRQGDLLQQQTNLQHTQLILQERQAEKDEERFYEDRIHQLRVLMAQTDNPEKLAKLQRLLDDAVEEYNEVEARNRKKERWRKIYFLVPSVIMICFGIYAFLAIQHDSSKNNQNGKSPSSVLKSSSSKKDSKIDKTKNNSAASVTNQKTFTMENYVGQAKSAVVEDLKTNHKISGKLIKIVEEESNEYETGQVIRQSPTAGSTYDLTSNRQIVLTVAKEVSSVAMPDFGSMQYAYANARSYLIQMGVSSSRIERVVDRKVTSTQADLVISQSPAAGKTIDLKSNEKITLYVTEATTPSSTSSSSFSSGSKNSSSSDDENHSSSTSSSEH